MVPKRKILTARSIINEEKEPGAIRRGNSDNGVFEKKRVIDVTLNLYDHPINVCMRKANEFIQETFLKPNDKEIDLKKVQQLCNYFKIAMPHRVSNDLKRLKSREFQIGAKERILICLYETVNKENGMVRPDMPTRLPA